MFYSQLLLSKKGALGVVWMAAHCHKRLKKDQVQHTNISSSVDKILDDEVHVVTHRILAFLLLGVVRIYSKKVEYLFHDCHEVMNRLCGFKTGKSTHGVSGVSRRHYYSISLPKRFELDAFDLEDQDSGARNLRSRDQTMRAGGQREDGTTRGRLDKENISFPGACSTSHTPPRDVFSSPSRNMIIHVPSLEIRHGTSFSLDHPEPMASDEAEEEQIHDKASNEDLGNNFQKPTDNMEYDDFHNRSRSLPSLEILRWTGFSLDDRLDPMVLDEVEKEQMNARPFDDNLRTNFQEQTHDMELNSSASPFPHGNDFIASPGVLQKSGPSLEHCPDFKMSSEADEPTDKEHGVGEEHLRTRLNFQEDEPLDLTESVDKADLSATKKRKILEVITPESRKGRRSGEHPMTIITPEVKIPEVGEGTLEVATIQTPAPKERAKIAKKRKALFFDLTTLVPNKVFKNWLDNPSDLKREKREVPHTRLQGWRAHKLGHIPQSFLEPSIPGISVALASLECKKSYAAASEPVTSSASQDDIRKSPVTHGAREQTPSVGSPVKPTSPDQIPIAPGTPVNHLDSFRTLEAGAVADSDILEPTSSLETIQKQPSLSEGPELDAMFQEETSSFEGDSQEKDTYSARTRMTEKYLRRKFLEKKRKKEGEVLNLSYLLAGKTKKESASLFYEILVLKTHDCIDVQQKNAYDDILLRETKQTSENLNQE